MPVYTMCKICLVITLFFSAVFYQAHAIEEEPRKHLYDYQVETLDGHFQSLNDYAGKVILIVNTASKCSFTQQFDGLEKLYQDYREQGLMILAFPCNQFAGQDPLDSQSIARFCRLNYGVTFPVFKKIRVNGKDAEPLFEHLKYHARGVLGSTTIKWNFTKFLINRKGEVVRRYAPATSPFKLRKAIETLLLEPVPDAHHPAT